MAGYAVRLRALRFGGLKPAVARSASEGGSANPPYVPNRLYPSRYIRFNAIVRI